MSYCDNLTCIKQGAEAKIYETVYHGRNAIVKERFSKKYRHPEIDEKLTKKRITQEIRALQRCRKSGVCTPCVYFVDLKRNVIFMEKVEGDTVKEAIVKARDDGYTSAEHLCKAIGSVLAKMHDANVVHGDLTTSNMIIRTNFGDSLSPFTIVLIDFGLSSSSALAEDKGVDLYVLERAFLSTHPGSEQLFETLLDVYKKESKNSSPVVRKLDEVRMRGRKRTMVG